jgi:hypothetical protein
MYAVHLSCRTIPYTLFWIYVYMRYLGPILHIMFTTKSTKSTLHVHFAIYEIVLYGTSMPL